MKTKTDTSLSVCWDMADSMDDYAEQLRHYAFHNVDSEQFRELEENWEKVKTILCKIGKTVFS